MGARSTAPGNSSVGDVTCVGAPGDLIADAAAIPMWPDGAETGCGCIDNEGVAFGARPVMPISQRTGGHGLISQ